MTISNKNDLKKLWDNYFNRLFEISTYTELLFCCALSKSSVYLDANTLQHNLVVHGKYRYFFQSLESGICYATVLSVMQLFEDGKDKRKQTISYLLDEAKKFKIDREKEYEELKHKHAASLQILKDARDTYFAHRNKDYALPIIPSSDDPDPEILTLGRILKTE